MKGDWKGLNERQGAEGMRRDAEDWAFDLEA